MNMKDVSLPSAQSILSDAELDQVRHVTALLCRDTFNPSSFEEKWDRVVEEYRHWEETFAGRHTSNLNQKLQFYSLLLAAFGKVCLENQPALLDLLLSSVRKPGDTVTIPTPTAPVTGTIIRREVTDRLGVLLTIRESTGRIFAHEVFD